MPRRATAFPCLFCSATPESHDAAIAHLLKRHPRKVLKLLGGVTFIAGIAFDVGRHEFSGTASKAVNAEDGKYRVTLAAVK